MGITTNLGLFLLSAAGISLSGVMLPGPLTAITIAKGYSDKNAGIMIAMGHGIIELPIMALIYLGFAHLFTSPEVKKVIGVAGGLMLIYLAFQMLRAGGKSLGEASNSPYSSLTGGIIATGANPYFYLWWVTIGVALIATAASFGILGVILFGLAHWTCDLIWYEFISTSVFKTRHLWTQRVQRIVFGICALVLAGFGAWYCFSVFL